MEFDASSRKQSIVIGYIFAAGIGMLLLQWALAAYNQVDTIPFSQFEQLVAQVIGDAKIHSQTERAK